MLASSTGGQMLVFLAFVFFAIVLSFGFHLITLFSTPKEQKIVGFVVDAVYGAFCLLFLWYMNFVFNDGQFRLFLILALVLGVLVYCKICMTVLDNVVKGLYNQFTKKSKPSSVEKAKNPEKSLKKH